MVDNTPYSALFSIAIASSRGIARSLLRNCFISSAAYLVDHAILSRCVHPACSVLSRIHYIRTCRATHSFNLSGGEEIDKAVKRTKTARKKRK